MGGELPARRRAARSRPRATPASCRGWSASSRGARRRCARRETTWRRSSRCSASRPTWHPESRRVTGLEVIPLEELGRAAINVTVRISGFFRDAFPHLVVLLDDAVARGRGARRAPERNFVAAHARADAERLAPPSARPPGGRRRRASSAPSPGRPAPGCCSWSMRATRATTPTSPRSTRPGADTPRSRLEGARRRRRIRDSFRRIEVAVKNVDSREHDILDSGERRYHGGMVATVRTLSGRDPAAYFGGARIQHTSSRSGSRRRRATCSAPASPTRAGSPR